MTGITMPSLLTPEDAARYARIDEDLLVHPWAVQDDYRSLIITRAEGNYLWDVAGNRYLDFRSQSWYANIGHGDRRVMELISKAYDLAGVYAFGTWPKLELAEKLLSLLPPGYARVFFGCNGSDAVEAALKVARLVTGRQNVIAFWHGYHGASMGATSVTGIPRWRLDVGEPVPGTIFVPPPYHYRSPFGGSTQDETDRLTVAYLRETIEQYGVKTIAAIIGEPILATGGGIIPGRGYWRQVRALCDEYDILLIGDEVVTGFGRTGRWFARDHYDYEPDMLLFGKGLSSGYLPLSAAVFRRNVVERFRSRLFPHGLTYSGHPLCCAAGLANIRIIEEDRLVANAAGMGAYLNDALQQIFECHPCVGEVRGLGLFAAVELVKDRASKASFDAATPLSGQASAAADIAVQVAGLMRDRGVLVHGLRARGIIKFAPPLTITRAEIDTGMSALDEVLAIIDRSTG